MTASLAQQNCLARLDQLDAQLLTQVSEGNLDLERLHKIANTKAYLAFVLEPMPIDPIAHVTAAHTQVRPYLEQLCDRDPTITVAAGNTGVWLYSTEGATTRA
ncbi:MAG: hypothetical protein GFH27_549289n307 [Chloroflexi bacterium AL-W]|nr:hypothetical protein [Chloroflexi bacterium AL-N1]NOK67039.1 hypothetical protein [Chloroflexi bacterium AL-N10]NOK74669.1 hypothetical protein [Chloroflexi bacterium AL-N5]NOK81641.1 hypothetical protein [Chloroflexi bacterium AL-W]NOK89111.1 hypothetical protein [Chloroflexi bacterium AL-N15]